MADFTYSYDPMTTDATLTGVFALRRVLGDTDVLTMNPALPYWQRSVFFSDQELYGFLSDANGDLHYAWAAALLALASKASGQAIRANLGGAGGSVDFTALADKFRATAQDVLTYYATLPAEQYAEVDYDTFSARQILWNAILRNTP